MAAERVVPAGTARNVDVTALDAGDPARAFEGSFTNKWTALALQTQVGDDEDDNGNMPPSAPEVAEAAASGGGGQQHRGF